MKRLKLDRIWWLVTPGNPLKQEQPPRTLDERMAAAAAPRASSAHRCEPVSESVIGTRYTADTINYLRRAVLRRAFCVDHGR